jgi:hypothetical protein
VACVCVGGAVTPDGARALLEVGTVSLPVIEGPMSVEAAMAAGPAPIERAAERLARIWSMAAT